MTSLALAEMLGSDAAAMPQHRLTVAWFCGKI